jgi:hypothetical protein
MELFGRNSKVQRFITPKSHVIRAYLGCYLTPTYEHCISILRMTGKNKSVIRFIHCNNKTISCSRNNYVDDISEELLDSPDG